ncbi:hemagglutinin [Oligella urethralis]|nr:hemagglutinin [Oligella urethralis]
MHGDVERSSQETFDYLYNQPDSRENFLHYMNTIDNRADFFAASNQYEQQIGSGVQWFGGADSVSRAAVTGLGADGNLSYLSFAMGKTLGNPPIYEWRKAAGDALIVGGFDNFKDLYNNQQDPVAWDIKQLKNEQALLQPIHEKYLSDKKGFTKASQLLTSEQMLKLNVFGSKQIIQDKQVQEGGINLLDYESRVSYGCKLLGYSEKQGCLP